MCTSWVYFTLIVFETSEKIQGLLYNDLSEDEIEDDISCLWLIVEQSTGLDKWRLQSSTFKRFDFSLNDACQINPNQNKSTKNYVSQSQR